MIKLIILTSILTSVSLSSCKKTLTTNSYDVEVVDYVTGQAINLAEVFKVTHSNWNFGCWCFLTTTETSIGLTNPSGRFGNTTTASHFKVRKAGYYDAEELVDCYFEKNQDTQKFHLFKKVMIELTLLPTQTYPIPNPYLEIWPVLRNGKLPVLSNRSLLFSANSSNHYPAFGDIMNRVLVLRNAGLITDTLYKTDVFVPQNTTPQLTIQY